MQMEFERAKSTGYMTNWAARLLARAIDRRLGALGLSSGHLPVIFALGDGGALPQKVLAQAASIEQPTMAATLARMERDGLIERRPDPEDGRSALIRLTPDAITKAQAVMAAVQAVNGEALAGIAADEREAFLKTLATIVANLERGLAR